VLWAANVPAANMHGDWQRISDAAAAGSAALRNPDLGRAKVAPALASPVNYFDVSFSAASGTAYHLWIRLRAQSDSAANDSVHMQFSDAVNAAGSSVMRIGTTASGEFVLQGGPSDTNGAHAWGWTDNGWGSLGTPVYFAASGTHTLRVQQREDGAIVDQIVISPDTYASSAPGPRENDTTILPAASGQR
jgi:glycosyl hydrolase family 115